MQRRRRVFQSLLAAGVLMGGSVGCATHFEGAAHIEGGPAQCQKKCEEWGLDFAGMVAMGEYSDACVCHVRSKSAAATTSEDAAAVAGGAAGVIMQMRAQQQQQGGGMVVAR